MLVYFLGGFFARLKRQILSAGALIHPSYIPPPHLMATTSADLVNLSSMDQKAFTSLVSRSSQASQADIQGVWTTMCASILGSVLLYLAGHPLPPFSSRSRKRWSRRTLPLLQPLKLLLPL
ncbi:hypothetical protein M407DRAFT_88165 [Tulasnella calospora MUT 4182]|uniref:Uncharacterized protein n=1 Tax=Tulasnella calospora MUT 4182 TaxID=1051891 RepID=A0A0C3QX32_9AGAM|nr:hypothetical protein M407DRAFT_88165 [Tulasnella calospora MUT 4182]